MWKRSLLLFALFASISCFFVGCQRRDKLPSQYAEKAYLNQQVEISSVSMKPRLDEPSREDLVINLDHYRDEDWERKGYESVDEWISRIQSYIEFNQDVILNAREDLMLYDREQKMVADKIQKMVAENNLLFVLINQPRDQSTRENEQNNRLQKAPFTLHLVKEGETLFSIANDYYETGEKVNEIALWNQGWIRHPDEIMAGLGIVLFPEDAQNQDAKIVERYIENLRNAAKKKQ